jgi:diacylglycerol kinase family enzyme
VVANPAMRGDVGRVVAALERQAPPGVRLEVHQTELGRSVAEVIGGRLGEAAAVVACGGDGTVADVVTGLGAFDLPVGIVPGGSTNVVARENRIPLNVEAAARLIFGRHAIARVDVGLCGDRRFLHMAGAGLDSRLFAATNPALKRRLGWLAYVAAGARNLVAPPSYFTIEADGVRVELHSPLVLVANGAAIARPSLPIYPGLRRDDGLLDVIAFSATRPVAIARTVGRFLARRLDRSPYVLHLRARRVALRAEPPLPLELDGDVVGETPATFGVAPGAVRLIVPER